MLTQELIEYIRQAQNAGMTETQIRKALAESGWASRDIEQALAAMNKPFNPEHAERIAASITPAVSTKPAYEPASQPSAQYHSAATPVQPSVAYQPSTPTQAQSTPTTAVEIPATHKRRTARMVGAGIGVLLLLGGGAYAYAAYTSLPRIVVAQAIKETAKTETYEAVGAFSVNVRESGASSSPQPMSITFTTDIVAQYDLRASSTPRMHADIKLGGDIGGLSMQGTGEVALIGSEFFFRVREIPAMLAADLGSEYSFIRDRWFSINPDTVPDDLRRAGMPEEAIKEFTSSMNGACSSRTTNTSFADILQANVGALTEQPPESIEGESSRVYALQGTQEFWVGILTSLVDESCTEERAALDEFLTTVDESLRDVSITATIAIGKRSHHVRRVTFEISGTATQPESVPLEMGMPSSVMFTARASVVFRKFNEPVEITKPDPATSLMDMVLESLTAARAKGADAGIKSMLLGLRAQAELYYDPRGSYGIPFAKGAPSVCPTTPGSTMFGSPEFQEAFEYIRQYNDNRPLTCATDNRAAGIRSYAISSPLATGGTFCIDSSGIAASSKVASVIGGTAQCK